MRLRESRAWAVSVLLAAVGCGQTRTTADAGAGAGGGEVEAPTMALDFAHSGTRLQAIGYSSNEAKVFRTFYDTELGFDCHFVPAMDGDGQRCVPNIDGPVLYTDASCTELATWVRGYGTAAWGTGDVISTENLNPGLTCPGADGPMSASFRVGEQLSEEVVGAPPIPIYRLSEGRCQAAGAPAKTTPPIFRMKPLSEQQLARAERVSINVGAGLRVARLLADDGAALTLHASLADRTPCEFQRDGECVPEPIARHSYPLDHRFSLALDADCSSPAFSEPYGLECGKPTVGVEDDGVAPVVLRALEVPAAVFSLQLTAIHPETNTYDYACEMGDVDASQAAAPGQDLTGTLPTATTLRRGTGPLYVVWHSRGQSELLPVLADFRRASPGVVPTPAFVDAAGRPCEIRSAPDGTLRCAFIDADEPTAELTTFPLVVDGPL